VTSFSLVLAHGNLSYLYHSSESTTNATVLGILLHFVSSLMRYFRIVNTESTEKLDKQRRQIYRKFSVSAPLPDEKIVVGWFFFSFLRGHITSI